MRSIENELKNITDPKKEKSNAPDERDSRLFGKDLKNLIQPTKQNEMAKPNCNIKTNFNSSTNFIFHKNDENLNIANTLYEKNSNIEEGNNISQIIIEKSVNKKNREYMDLVLANSKFKDTYLKTTDGSFIKFMKTVQPTPLNVTSEIPSNTLKKTAKDEGFKISSSPFTRKSLAVLDQGDYEERNNPQFVVEYVKDIFRDLKLSENINEAKHGYFETVQSDINDKMRAILIDWLIEVHLKFKLNPETLYLSVNLIDRYLNTKQVHRAQLQLVGVSALLVASKYEEIYAPEIRDFIYITDKSYTFKEILKMEYQILSTLQFDILFVSPYTFLVRLHFLTPEKSNQKIFYLAQYIMELTLIEYNMLHYSSSLTAACCYFLARKVLKVVIPWPQNLIRHSKYEEADLKTCSKEICKILQLIPRINLKASYNKFSTSKYCEVAKISLSN